jgi:hypothetical protein
METFTADKGPGRLIRAALIARGSSLALWARSNGFEERTAYQVVRRWAGRTDRAPHGGLARQIIASLRDELGAELLPEPRKHQDP